MAIHKTQTASQEQIVAHFSWLKSILWTLALIIIFAALVHVMIVNENTDMGHRDLPLGIAGILAALLGVWIMFLILFQLFVRRARGIWARNGYLYYLDFYGGISFTRVLINAIEKPVIDTTHFWRPVGIVLNLKEGDRRYVPTILLREKKEAIQRSIEQML